MYAARCSRASSSASPGSTVLPPARCTAAERLATPAAAARHLSIPSAHQLRMSDGDSGPVPVKLTSRVRRLRSPMAATPQRHTAKQAFTPQLTDSVGRRCALPAPHQQRAPHQRQLVVLRQEDPQTVGQRHLRRDSRPLACCAAGALQCWASDVCRRMLGAGRPPVHVLALMTHDYYAPNQGTSCSGAWYALHATWPLGSR